MCLRSYSQDEMPSEKMFVKHHFTSPALVCCMKKIAVTRGTKTDRLTDRRTWTKRHTSSILQSITAEQNVE